MTASERFELSDKMTAATLALNKARLLCDEIKNEYFDKYDPSLSADKRACSTALAYEHPRYSTFLDMLGDYLYEVAEAIPSEGWIDAQTATEEAAKE